jgi:hypothetical protein
MLKHRLLNRLSIAMLTISLAACAGTPPAPSATVTTPTAIAVAVSDPAPTATPEPPIPTTTIIKAYEADQVAADAQYKDKTLIMTGKVTNINDVFGTQALLLRDSESDTGLQCYLTDSADAAKVAIGQTITIEGTIKGGELGFFMVAEPCKVIP